MKKNILLGAGAGIAVFKSVRIASLLVKKGCSVRVVLTPSAMDFIQPLTFEAITGEKVFHERLSISQDGIAAHISLARWADSTLVAPATADLIARMAGGLADDLLTTTLLCVRGKRVLAPAMNTLLWTNPLVQRNIATLASMGWEIAGPTRGPLAEGEEGMGRMLEPEELVDIVLDLK